MNNIKRFVEVNAEGHIDLNTSYGVSLDIVDPIIESSDSSSEKQQKNIVIYSPDQIVTFKVVITNKGPGRPITAGLKLISVEKAER